MLYWYCIAVEYVVVVGVYSKIVCRRLCSAACRICCRSEGARAVDAALASGLGKSVSVGETQNQKMRTKADLFEAKE